MQDHADQIANCVLKLKDFLTTFKKSFEEGKKLCAEISEFEHKADQIKDKIRNNLGKSLMLPVNKGNLLDILSIQDAIGDTAEDIAVLATMKKDFTIPDELFTLLDILLDKAIDTFKKYREIIDLLDELLEATFTGPQAEQIRKEIKNVARLEHETDKAQKIFLQKFFDYEENLSKSEFFLISKISKGIGDIANISEKAANKIRLILLG
jgi:predicted phosphate transport protein (TIGR00153 family)